MFPCSPHSAPLSKPSRPEYRELDFLSEFARVFFIFILVEAIHELDNFLSDERLKKVIKMSDDWAPRLNFNPGILGFYPEKSQI